MMTSTATLRNGLILAAFGLLTTAGIATTYQNTKDAIAEQERLAQARALLEIMPEDTHNNDMLQDVIALVDSQALGLRSQQTAHLAKIDDATVAVLLPVTARDGYSGDIQLLVGIRADGQIAGVRVVQHNETPGLGDKVELKKSKWILSFNDTSLDSPSSEAWTVKKDGGHFDSFTGATITPRAVTKAVKNALVYFADHRDQLINDEHAL
jgi:electron transport complex protein RnfG